MFFNKIYKVTKNFTLNWDKKISFQRLDKSLFSIQISAVFTKNNFVDLHNFL